MSIDKEPMSAAYSAVFILSILMMLAVFFGSAFAQSKAGGFGVWVWGYTAWLMKKRRNSDLATLFKFLMWLSVVGLAACALLFLNSADRSNGGNAVDVVVTALSLLLCIAIEYGLYTFFKKQVNAALVPIQSRPTSDESVRPPVNGETTGTNTNSSFVTPMARGTPSAAHTNSAAPFLNVTPQGHSHLPTATPFSTVAVEGQPSTTDLAVEALYEKALNELSTGKKPGLWAMALAQTANGGNPDGAYIALRVEQMRHEHAQLRPDQNENPTAAWVLQSQPSSSASETAKFANESRVLQLRMHFDTSVESVQRGKDTAGMFDKHYQTLHRFRSAIDARKLVWLCDYELLGPGEDSRFETTYTLRRSAAYDPIAEFKDEREFVNWALLNFAIRHSNDVGYI